MDSPADNTFVYEVHHTVITVIEGVRNEDEAEAVARHMLENGPVDRLSITEGAEVFQVVVESVFAVTVSERG